MTADVVFASAAWRSKDPESSSGWRDSGGWEKMARPRGFILLYLVSMPETAYMPSVFDLVYHILIATEIDNVITM